MPKFSIAFATPGDKMQLLHRIIDSPDQDAALKTFFNEEATRFYSDDDQGYFYFKEDFNDASYPCGSIIQCD